MDRGSLRFAILAGLLLFAPLVCHAGYEDGKAAGRRGDFSEAARQFAEDARAGHAGSQLALGLFYAAGLGIGQIDAEAAQWFKRAADQGNAHAQYNLGLMLLVGIGAERDERKGVRWLRAAAGMRLPQAQSDLGALHFFGREREIGFAEALSWLQAAAERGHPLAQLNLACGYLTGGPPSWRGFEAAPLRRLPGPADNLGRRDELQALRWFRAAAEQGVVVAQFNLGVMHERGLGINRSLLAAMNWYAKSAEADFAPAFINLARLYESEDVLMRDRAAALQLRLRAWQKGINRARENPIVVMNFGVRTLRHLDGRKIWADRHKLETDDVRGGTYVLLFEPDFLIDPDLGLDFPPIFPSIGPGAPRR